MQIKRWRKRWQVWIRRPSIHKEHIAAFGGNQEQRLVELILEGKSDVADSDIETAWKVNQSEPIFIVMYYREKCSAE